MRSKSAVDTMNESTKQICPVYMPASACLAAYWLPACCWLTVSLYFQFLEKWRVTRDVKKAAHHQGPSLFCDTKQLLACIATLNFAFYGTCWYLGILNFLFSYLSSIFNLQVLPDESANQ